MRSPASPAPVKAALALAVTALGITACTGAEGTAPARGVSAVSPQATSPRATSPQAASPRAASPRAASPRAASPRAASTLSAGTAAELPLTEAVRGELADAYFASQRYAFPDERRANVVGPNNVKYGVIRGVDGLPATYYAVGNTGFAGNRVSLQGGPHVWRKEDGATWIYLGDTGLSPCSKVPRDLYVLWGFDTTYGAYNRCGR